MPFKSDKQRKYLWMNKPDVAKKFSEHANNSKETAESSASSWATFKEEIPKKLRIESAAGPEDTLMGRLASRMASRDMIDELNLGPKGRTGKQKEAVIADNEIPSRLMLGAGLHSQTQDKKTSNFSNPIPNNAVSEGNNMAEQAKSNKNVYGRNILTADNDEEHKIEPEWLKHGSDPDSEYDSKQLKMGTEVEYEHTNDPEVAKAIAKAHLAEIPDYYTRLAKMEKEGKAALK